MNKYHSMIGKVLRGRYTIIDIIGIGGMAVVFNAYDKVSGETVALKMLCDENTAALPSMKSQFVNEAKAMSLLSHSGVVKLFDSSLDKPPYYFVMEYVDGVTLKDYMSKKKVLEQHEVIDFSLQLLSALSHIHSKGIVHCDIKPHNILLMRNGRLKITDFGISRMPGVIPDIPEDKAVGTVYYVSPEQAEGKVLDHRSDIYSLGIMMYQMASGKLPFMSSDIDKVARMQSFAPPKRPRAINPEISKGLEQVILKAIAKKPYMRFTDATEMRHYIEILRKNPSAVFRLAEKNPEHSAHSHHRGYHSKGSIATVAGILAAFILSVSISAPMIYKSLTSKMDGDIYTTFVPDLKGRTLDEAADKLDPNVYDVEIIYDYSSLRAPGTVIDQDIPFGTKKQLDPTKEQITIVLTVSAEKAPLKLIDVTALSPEEAEKALTMAGYSVKFENAYNDVVPKGLVCSTYPEANSEVMGGGEITVYISLGADIVFVAPKNYVGYSENEAAEDVATLGLKIGRVTYERSAMPAGTVIAQSASPGVNIPTGTEISFVISGGPDYNS